MCAGYRLRMRRILSVMLACWLLAMLQPSHSVAQTPIFSPLVGFEYGVLTAVSRDSGAVNPYRTVDGFGSSYNSTIWIGLEVSAQKYLQDWLDLALRADIGFGVGRFTSSAYNWRMATGEPVPDDSINVVNELMVHSSQTLARLETMASVRPFGALTLGLGLWGSLRVRSTMFATERLLEPAGEVFPETRSNERTLGTQGNLESTPFHFGLQGAIGYEIPITKAVTLRPMVSSRLNIPALSDGLGLRAVSMEASIATMLDFSQRGPFRPDEIPDSTFLFVGRSNINASVNLFNADPDALDSSVATIRSQRTRHDMYMPLLPFVFFEEHSGDLPARYIRLSREAADTITNFHYPVRQPEAIYHNILNILGMRMREEPATSIRLTVLPVHGEAAVLGTERAAQIRSYLYEIWSIDTARIAISSIGSNGCRPLAVACIRITSSHATLLAPVVLKWLVEDHIMPHIGLSKRMRSELGVKEWDMAIGQGTRQFLNFEHDKETSSEINVVLPVSEMILDSIMPPLTARLNVTDFSGASVTAQDELQLNVSSSKEDNLPEREIRIYLLFAPDSTCPEHLASNKVLTGNMLAAAHSGSILQIASSCGPTQHWCAPAVGIELLKQLTARGISMREIRIVENPPEPSEHRKFPEEELYATAVRLTLEQLN